MLALVANSLIETNGHAARCPFHAGTAGLEAGTMLMLLHAKRMVIHRTMNADGAPELILFYGDKEISFDETDLFPFAETLARQKEFRASDAVGWGEGLDWQRVAPLLEQLIQEDILVRLGDQTWAENIPNTIVDRSRMSPLPAAPCHTPRDWRDSIAITRELTGVPVDPAHLELVVPVFRVAHIAIDSDGRQVGEANVFPRALRVAAPTEWLVCTYSGTRYLAERPMNATALKAMRGHWQQMMAALVIIRRAFLKRFPSARKQMTVGDIERLAVLVLSVPTYALVRARKPVANGSLHPALSSLFRVTDGVRMVMHQMLFIPIGEPALPPDTPMDAARIHAYAERNYSFHSETGVCAGPKILVEEFLKVLVDGHVPDGADSFQFDDAIQDALADIEDAFDYGLLGLRVYAASFSIWPAMARLYGDLAEAAQAAVAQGAAGLIPSQKRLQESATAVETTTYLATDSWRAARERVYADMFAKCGEACRIPEIRAQRTDSLFAHLNTDADLVAVLANRIAQATTTHPADCTGIARLLAEFIARMQACLTVADICQSQLNKHIGRQQPLRKFSSAEADVHNLLQGADVRPVPYIFNEIEALFAIMVHVDPDHINMCNTASHSSSGISPDGAGAKAQ